MTTFFGNEESATAARQQLGQFLRMHREALKPEEFGFVRGQRRRSPGLLRYEVAQLAAVSDTWYTWLEQGRDIHVSASALDSIARALRLDEHGRQYIRYLAGVPVAEPEVDETDVDVQLTDLVHETYPHSACIMNGTYDLLVWNRTFELIWWNPDRPAPLGPNALWSVLTDPVFRDRMENWEREVGGLVAKFRFESARHPGSARFAEVTEALHAASPDFTRMWSEARVQPISGHRISIVHPDEGRLTFRKLQLRVVDQPRLMLVMQRAADEETARALDRILARHGAERPGALARD